MSVRPADPSVPRSLSGPDLDQALAQEQVRRGQRLAELLDEAALLRAHRQLDLPGALRGYLDARSDEVAGAIAELLVQWLAVGGSVELGLPGESGVGGAVEVEEEVEEVEVEGAVEEGAVEGGAVEEGAVEDVEVEEDDEEDDLELVEETEECPRPELLGSVGELPQQAGSQQAGSPQQAPPQQPAPQQPAPPPTVRKPTPRPPPATLHQIELLSAHLRSGQAQIAPQPQRPWRATLAARLSALQPGDDLDEEQDRLLAEAGRCEEWTAFPREVQQALLGLVTARLRTLQDDHGRGGWELDRAFSALTRFSALHQPGYINGLTRGHEPEADTWDDDADAWLQQLEQWLPQDAPPAPGRGRFLAELQRLLPELDLAPAEARPAVAGQIRRTIQAALDSGVSSRDAALVRIVSPFHDQLEGRQFKALRRAIRDARGDNDEDDNTAERADQVPADWPCWHVTRGKIGILVGGDPREPNRRRIQEAFGFARLDWPDMPDKVRSLQSLADQVRRRKVDVVIMLGAFLGHSYDDILLPACREAGVPFAHVDHGYGVTRIRLAIERFTG